MMNLESMLPLLQCPRSKTPLRLHRDEIVSATGETYPIVNGKPILVRTIRDMHRTPPDQRIVSQNTAKWAPDSALPSDGVAVNLGSGNVPCEDPRVISIDVLPNTNVDLVCEAEALPFADESIDLVSSGAVFEHVHSPLIAAAETRRVLKAGGQFRIDTAFMQGYHGFPGHYFNMTPQACETFLADDFQLLRSYTTDASIFHPVGQGLAFLMENLPQADREAFLNLPLREVMAQMHEKVPAPWQGRVTEHMRRTLCSQFVVEARKPARYRDHVEVAITTIGENEYATLKRDFYAARMGMIMEHHGIVHFRMRAIEDYGVAADAAAMVPDLDNLLQGYLVCQPGDLDDWRRQTRGLVAARQNLVSLRDRWITLFLTAKEQATVRMSAALRP